MLNEVKLIGNLGSDPTVKTTPNGQVVATLRVATTERWMDKSGVWQEATDWHTVVVWGQGAQRAQERLHKGSRVFVAGKLKPRSWEDRDGQKRTSVEVLADRVLPLDQSPGQQSHDRPRQPAARPQAAPKAHMAPADNTAYFDDDVPF